MAVVAAEEIQGAAPFELLRILLPVRQQGGLPRHCDARYLIYVRTLTVLCAASVWATCMASLGEAGLGSVAAQVRA